ncbi:hypothetical protein EST38_g14396 [Candolleomyces aberdarensis]|uniref:Mixed lineage kinase domain-containing protein n=1 Tax=Candolleomyces aberdarensis TaxID=2316362 RepID=A0A4Q2CYE1_9AGAR|nr:hypothetical protein EST38_g14396 [Candolleomyces aberdarensis]
MSTGVTRGQTSLNAASNAMEPVVNNPALSTAIEVFSSLSDVGKAIPFVAPAFILLKIIIDIERRAQDVDAKCNDILERITFLLSHLPIVRKMHDEGTLMQATKQVAERMNEAVKGAAALIAAYRKQSPIARRLSISNREKFSTCADALNVCCSDLLLSLQIRQSQQLDALTNRGVPLDDDDQAAMTFVETHGGDFEAVQYDRELVKEFAEERHLPMDDSVMGELEDGVVAEAVGQVSARLETIVKDNLSAAIAGGLKDLATQLTTVQQEQSFVCVQCESSFTRSSNHPKACSYHKAPYDSWSKSYGCCDTPHPCQCSSHREKHHCDYPYGTFFPRVWAINNYVDTTDDWASVTDTSLEEEGGTTEKASVGQLLRWKSRGERLKSPTILISVGTVRWAERYYFNTFTLEDLQNISKSVRHSKRTLIFRTSPSEDAYASAEWILAVSGKITGVRITAKANTSSTPFVRVCPIDLATGQKSGDVLAVSEGGLRSYAPASPYVLPETVHVGPELKDTPLRAARKDFKTRTSSPGLRVIMRSVDEPPLAANPHMGSARFDYMHGTVSVFNNNAPGSNVPITIAAAKAAFRYVGEKQYTDVEGEGFKIVEGAQFPLTIDPRQSVTFKFEAAIPRTEEDVKKDVRWWNPRAFCARHRPLRVKFVLEDIEGEEASLVSEYVFKPFPFSEKKENDLATFWFDEPDMIARNMIAVSPGDSSDVVAKIDGQEVKVNQLQQLVYKALKTGKTEIDLEIGREKGYGEWEWKASALVDISCRRVYAFKVLLHEGKSVPEEKRRFACLGYAPCPDYGDVIPGKTRPVSYATESIRLPPLQPYVPVEYPADDKVDDWKPVVPPKPARTLSSSNGVPPSPSVMSNGTAVPLQIPDELNTRLASLDVNLGRIADALEQLVGALQARR